MEVKHACQALSVRVRSRTRVATCASCAAAASEQLTYSHALAGQQRNNLDRREDLVRRVIRLAAQRVPHRLGMAHVLLARFLERGSRPTHRAFCARRRPHSRARRGRRRSPRTSGHRAIRAARWGRARASAWIRRDADAATRMPAPSVRRRRAAIDELGSSAQPAVTFGARRCSVANRHRHFTVRTAGRPRPACSSFRPVRSSTSRTAR